MRNSAKVLDLDTFRRLRTQVDGHLVAYLKSDDACLKTLCSFPFLKIKTISSTSKLRHFLLESRADLFLIDSDISWADPAKLIETIHFIQDTPVLAIGRPKTPASTMKQIFAAGAYDALYAPLKRDDLKEALDVLLKLRQQFSL